MIQKAAIEKTDNAHEDLKVLILVLGVSAICMAVMLLAGVAIS